MNFFKAPRATQRPKLGGSSLGDDADAANDAPSVARPAIGSAAALSQRRAGDDDDSCGSGSGASLGRPQMGADSEGKAIPLEDDGAEETTSFEHASKYGGDGFDQEDLSNAPTESTIPEDSSPGSASSPTFYSEDDGISYNDGGSGAFDDDAGARHGFGEDSGITADAEEEEHGDLDAMGGDGGDGGGNDDAGMDAGIGLDGEGLEEGDRSGARTIRLGRGGGGGSGSSDVEEPRDFSGLLRPRNGSFSAVPIASASTAAAASPASDGDEAESHVDRRRSEMAGLKRRFEEVMGRAEERLQESIAKVREAAEELELFLGSRIEAARHDYESYSQTEAKQLADMEETQTTIAACSPLLGMLPPAAPRRSGGRAR
ncbi:unnamed protein product [Phaeothamnion confervicola]